MTAAGSTNVVLLVLAAAAMAYLFVALVFPERF